MDIVQRTKQAIVAVLDTAPAIAALTGRPSLNVVPWGSFEPLPCINYVFVTAPQLGSPGDWRRFEFQFSAFAGTEPPDEGPAFGGEALCDALLEQLEALVTHVNFAALPSPLDIHVNNRNRRGAPYDDDLGAYRADLDLTLTVRS